MDMISRKESLSLFPVRVAIEGTDLSCSQRDLDKLFLKNLKFQINLCLCKTFKTA